MLMLQEQTKSSFGTAMTYERADELVTRAAKILLTHWSTFFDQMNNNESFLLSRLRLVGNYAYTAKYDDYLSNLWLVWIGCRNEGVPLGITLERMEKVRKVIADDPYDRKGRKQFAAVVIPETLYSDDPATKLKYLFRFLVARQVAATLTERLNIERRKKKLQLFDARYNGFPFSFSENLDSVIKQYT